MPKTKHFYQRPFPNIDHFREHTLQRRSLHRSNETIFWKTALQLQVDCPKHAEGKHSLSGPLSFLWCIFFRQVHASIFSTSPYWVSETSRSDWLVTPVGEVNCRTSLLALAFAIIAFMLLSRQLNLPSQASTLFPLVSIKRHGLTERQKSSRKKCRS